MKFIEEDKRESATNPLQRWKNIEAAIAFAETDMKPEFRRNRPRRRDTDGKVHFY